VASSRVNFTFSVVDSSVIVQYNDHVKRCITGKPRFDSKQRQKLGFCMLFFQTGCGSAPFTCPIIAVGCLSGVEPTEA
jgi:hypothetical protein